MTASCNFHNQLLFTACCLITVGWIKANRVCSLPILFFSTDCIGSDRPIPFNIPKISYNWFKLISTDHHDVVPSIVDLASADLPSRRRLVIIRFLSVFLYVCAVFTLPFLCLAIFTLPQIYLRIFAATHISILFHNDTLGQSDWLVNTGLDVKEEFLAVSSLVRQLVLRPSPCWFKLPSVSPPVYP